MSSNSRPLAVVIMAAGKGTRMNSDLPKVLHEVQGKPMISHVIHMAQELDPQTIVAIIGHKYKLVEETLKDEPIEFAYQLEQLGTGHAVDQCRDQLADFDGDVLVLSGDVPLLQADTIRALIATHERMSAAGSLLTADFEDPTGYGRVLRKPDNSLDRIVEHKDADEDQLQVREINAGIYIFDCRTLFRLLPMVGNNNAQGEYYLPDVIPHILAEKGIIAIEKIQNNSEIQGVNTLQQLEKLNEST